jgi:hypothetical protein
MKPGKARNRCGREGSGHTGFHVEPGPRDCENTINQLMDVLDDTQLIESVDEVRDGRSEAQRTPGPQ